jgi:hypothetical protein
MAHEDGSVSETSPPETFEPVVTHVMHAVLNVIDAAERAAVPGRPDRPVLTPMDRLPSGVPGR